MEKCDYYGNSALHYAVRSRNLKCVSFLINFEPKLIWMMDINNLNAKQLAEQLDYTEIASKLNEFISAQNLSKLYKFQLDELKRAQKRRDKYVLLMKSAAKLQLDEYKKSNKAKSKLIRQKQHHQSSYLNTSSKFDIYSSSYSTMLASAAALNDDSTCFLLSPTSPPPPPPPPPPTTNFYSSTLSSSTLSLFKTSPSLNFVNQSNINANNNPNNYNIKFDDNVLLSSTSFDDRIFF